VRVGREHVVLDAGAGTMQRLHRLGVTFLQLDRIFLTHFHPDHCLDLVSFLFAMRIPRPARTKPLAIYGPRGLGQLYRRLETAFQGWITPRTYRLILKEIGETTLRFNGYTVCTKRMNHLTRALGYRIEAQGKRVTYSGDTDVCREIVALGRGADLLILECSLTDEQKGEGHLTPTECGRIAAQASCRRLVLTHFYPVFRNYDIRSRVRRQFRGPLSLAKDFSSFRI
jgi:ribonuclease BN (tRNA processing enzyme)